MKNLTVFILLVLFFASCSKPNRWQIIHEKENSELATGVKNDTIFLGFVFGMSRSEVNSRLEKLAKSDKLTRNQITGYTYTFHFDLPESAEAMIRPYFFNDSLYSFLLDVSNDKIYLAELVQLKLANMFIHKYGSGIIVPSMLDEKKNDYIWINGNRRIEVNAPTSSSFFVQYINVPIERRIDDIKMKKDSDRIQENLKDL